MTNHGLASLWAQQVYNCAFETHLPGAVTIPVLLGTSHSTQELSPRGSLPSAQHK